jgi:hypothetical protein
VVNPVAIQPAEGPMCPLLRVLFDQCTTADELTAISRAHERIVCGACEVIRAFS